MRLLLCLGLLFQLAAASAKSTSRYYPPDDVFNHIHPEDSGAHEVSRG